MTEPLFTQEFYDEIEHFARIRAPEEACALLLFKHRRWQLQPMPNLSVSPKYDFAMDEAAVCAAQKQGQVIIFHSHPNGPAYPSKQDMLGFLGHAHDWLVADLSVQPAAFFCLSHRSKTDLHQRPFRHGVTDCYSLIRDYYQQRLNIELPDFARSWHWWSQGDNYYQDNFTKAGFEALKAEASLKPGDIALIRMRAAVPNHAAIWCGDGLIFHHLAGRLGFDLARQPQYDPAERFAPFIEGWLRHHTLF